MATLVKTPNTFAYLCVLLIGVVAVGLAGPIGASFIDTEPAGPESFVTGALSSAPSAPVLTNAGCIATAPTQTNIAATWNDAQSATPDASGGYLVSGYSLMRAPDGSPTYSQDASTAGSPPATSVTDVTGIGNTAVGLVTNTSSNFVYPVPENTLTPGAGIATNANGGEPNAAQTTPDGQAAVLAESGGGRIQVLSWSGTAWSVAATLSVPVNHGKPYAVAIDPVQIGGFYVAYVVTNHGATKSGYVYPVVLKGASTVLPAPITIGNQSAAGAGAVSTTAALVTPDGKYLFVTNYNSNSFSVITTATSAEANYTLSGSANLPFALSVLPNSATIYLAERKNSDIVPISEATFAAGAAIALPANSLNDPNVPGSGAPNALAMSPTGSMLYVTEAGAGQVQEIATATNTITGTISTGGAGSSPVGLALSPNGCTLYVTGYNSNNIYSIDITAPTPAVTTAFTMAYGTADPQPMEVTPDSTYLFVPEQYGNQMDYYDATTSTETSSPLPGTGTAGSIAIPPVVYTYTVTATHANESSNTSPVTTWPVGWNPGAWQ